MDELNQSTATKRDRCPVRPCLFVLVLAVVGAPGCRSSRSNSAAPAGSAAAAQAGSQATRKVTADDCDLWGKHGAKAFVASVEFASAQCPPAAKALLKSQFEDQIVSLEGGATTVCMGHVGETYKEADAACYMKAKDALSLRACRFAPMIAKDDTDWGLALKGIHDHCSVVPPPGAGAPPPGNPAPHPAPGTTAL